MRGQLGTKINKIVIHHMRLGERSVVVVGVIEFLLALSLCWHYMIMKESFGPHLPLHGLKSNDSHELKSGDSSVIPLETSADFSANRQLVVTPSIGTKIASKGNDNCLCASAKNFKAEEIREAVGLRKNWTRALPFAVERDFNRYSAIGGRESEGLLGFDTKESHQRFDFMGPVAPQCKSIESFGQGDMEKRACALTELVGAMLPGSRCTIISLGSNNQWGFEEAIFANFPDCEIHTFDCTLAKEVRPPIEISSRTTLHPVCVGSQDAIVDGRPYLSWKSITRLINVTDAPLYLKMDIEGFEYEVLRSIVEENFLSPMQMAFELHFKTDIPVSWIKRSKSSVEIAMFLEYLYHQAGYFLID